MDTATQQAISPSAYGEDYFEQGIIKGISGYMNYSWMPEATLRMTHFIIQQLGITPEQTVLDFGCAKGFAVKALRIFDIPAYGVDISSYAIAQAPREVADYCRTIESCRDLLGGMHYDWVFAKDVLEHLCEAQIDDFLAVTRKQASGLFLSIPLGRDDTSGKFAIPAYDLDVTHITARTQGWWEARFRAHGWTVAAATKSFKGVKENWTHSHPDGNAFFVLKA